MVKTKRCQARCSNYTSKSVWIFGNAKTDIADINCVTFVKVLHFTHSEMIKCLQGLE